MIKIQLLYNGLIQFDTKNIKIKYILKKIYRKTKTIMTLTCQLGL